MLSYPKSKYGNIAKLCYDQAVGVGSGSPGLAVRLAQQAVEYLLLHYLVEVRHYSNTTVLNSHNLPSLANAAGMEWMFGYGMNRVWKLFVDYTGRAQPTPKEAEDILKTAHAVLAKISEEITRR